MAYSSSSGTVFPCSMPCWLSELRCPTRRKIFVSSTAAMQRPYFPSNSTVSLCLLPVNSSQALTLTETPQPVEKCYSQRSTHSPANVRSSAHQTWFSRAKRKIATSRRCRARPASHAHRLGCVRVVDLATTQRRDLQELSPPLIQWSAHRSTPLRALMGAVPASATWSMRGRDVAMFWTLMRAVPACNLRRQKPRIWRGFMLRSSVRISCGR